jgi:hypothetical protein
MGRQSQQSDEFDIQIKDRKSITGKLCAKPCIENLTSTKRIHYRVFNPRALLLPEIGKAVVSLDYKAMEMRYF